MPSPEEFQGEFQAGDIVGDTYIVLGYIGRGAMGHVYHVRHNALRAEYALKTLSSDQVSEITWRRFQNEAHAISIMQHPNVVSIFNLGLHDNALPFYVMELLKGRDLGEKLDAEGPLSTQDAVAIFIEVCAGISYAHKKGIVHRDIKPSNIFLLETPGATGEKIKVVDFGIAKLSRTLDPKNQELTGLGDVLGTPYYMSPEQCVGQRVDARSDIYSLGCTLFQALTGNLPFRGRNATETMLLHSSAPPPSLSKASGGKEFPERLEDIIFTCLAKEQAERYQTVDQLAKDLALVFDDDKPTMVARGGGTIKGSAAHSTVVVLNNAGDSLKNKLLLMGVPPLVGIVAIGILVIGIVVVVTVATGTAPISSLVFWRPKPIAKVGPPLPLPQQLQKPLPRPDAETDNNYMSELAAARNKAEAGKPKPQNLLVTNQKMTASLASEKPFCTIITKGGKQVRRFDFPEDVVLGLFKTRDNDQHKPTIGILEYPIKTHITFIPSDIVGRYPDCLKRFHPGDISSVRLFPNACTDAIFKATLNLSDIKKLNLAGCRGLTYASIPTLGGFHNLTSLDASDSGIGLAFLDQSGCLDHIEDLIPAKEHDVLPLLRRLKSAKMLQRLRVSRTKLSGEDFHALAALSQLTNLDLFQVPMTRQDLRTLSTLQNLDQLHIGETGLDGTTLDVLKNFKALTYLDFCGNQITKEQLAYLITLHNFTELDLQRTDLGTSVIEVLKAYKPLKTLRIKSKKLKPGEFEEIRDALKPVKVT